MRVGAHIAGKNFAWRSLCYTLWVASLLAVAGIVIMYFLIEAHPNKDTLDIYKFGLEIFKVILAGFVVAMLGILIPAVLTESRYRFEQRKESRIVYSAAKTSIDYLKLRLSMATLEEAVTALQQAHFNKHMAQMYEDFPEWLILRYKPEDKMTPDRWDEIMYCRLFNARKVLEKKAQDWNQLEPDKRIELLKEALPTKAEVDCTEPATTLEKEEQERAEKVRGENKAPT